MTAVTKPILVIPSAGENNSNAIPQELEDFCAALRTATPTSAVRTDVRGTDLGQINLAANMKALQVDPEEYGVSVDWTPVLFHAPSSSNPATWGDDVNLRGILYAATVDDTEYFIGVRLDD